MACVVEPQLYKKLISTILDCRFTPCYRTSDNLLSVAAYMAVPDKMLLGSSHYLDSSMSLGNQREGPSFCLLMVLSGHGADCHGCTAIHSTH